MSISSVENIEEAVEPRVHGHNPALSQPFSLGQWQVIPELNRLKAHSDGEERQLEPRLVKLLCFLAANEDRVLSRDALVQELWPRVVVNENSLTRAVSELRKQLQTADSCVPNYIETIPKRGYRLIPRVQFSAANVDASDRSEESTTLALFSLGQFRMGVAVSAACLSLIFASWFSLDAIPGLERESEAILLSDEVLDVDRDFLGGELQLSTMDNSTILESTASLTLSPDEKQYAFIEYDTSGSTIFLGDMNTAIEPVPVYFSNRHLFNLAWSPVGNNLLFAMQPSLTSTAVYTPINETADLIMLNLNTLETSRLVEDLNPAETKPANGLNLT